MARQKGQSMVEFVLTVPILMLLVFGMIYSGFIYADYLQYNNAARDVARDIAVQSEENRSQLVRDLNGQVPSVVKRYIHPLTNLYKGAFSVELAHDPLDGEKFTAVKVTIDFRRQSGEGVVPVFARGVLPEGLPEIEYTMRLEEDKKDTEEEAAETPEGEG